MALTVDEREQFLAEPHIGALSVLEGPDRGPLTVPIWYQYTPGGGLWIRTAPESRKARALAAAGRFTMMVQRVAPTVRYVSVEGVVGGTAPDTPALARELAERYLPAEAAEAYLEFERTQLPEHTVVHLRPQRWLSADLGGG